MTRRLNSKGGTTAMIVLLDLIVLGVGYYTFSYGFYLWKIQCKKLEGFGVFLITLIGALFPLIFIHVKI